MTSRSDVKYLKKDIVSRVTKSLYGKKGDPVTVINVSHHVAILETEDGNRFPALLEDITDDKDYTCDTEGVDGSSPKTQSKRTQSPERVMQADVRKEVATNQVSLW